MSEESWDEFEDYWKAIRNDSPIQLVSNRASDIKEQLEIACDKTSFEIKEYAKQFNGQTLTTELLGKLMARTVALFMAKWQEGLRGQNLSGLIEIILEGQDLTPAEMKGFLKALPDSLLQRILDSAIGAGTGSGVHALIALEHHFRKNGVRNYNLGRVDGRVYAEFEAQGQTLRVFLDEVFKLNASPQAATRS